MCLSSSLWPCWSTGRDDPPAVRSLIRNMKTHVCACALRGTEPRCPAQTDRKPPARCPDYQWRKQAGRKSHSLRPRPHEGEFGTLHCHVARSHSRRTACPTHTSLSFKRRRRAAICRPRSAEHTCARRSAARFCHRRWRWGRALGPRAGHRVRTLRGCTKAWVIASASACHGVFPAIGGLTGSRPFAVDDLFSGFYGTRQSTLGRQVHCAYASMVTLSGVTTKRSLAVFSAEYFFKSLRKAPPTSIALGSVAA